ncbi:MAG: Fe-S cluster assembly scaffold protein NifU [Patescibacteria group bacterium]
MDISDLYSKKVLEHFKNPRNMGEIKDADGVATVGNMICGDVMRMFIKVERKNGQEYIKDVKFQTLGCGAAISTSSMVTTMIKGKLLSEALKITNKAVAEALGGLPRNKLHCSVLAEEAVKKAIEDYQKKKSKV